MPFVFDLAVQVQICLKLFRSKPAISSPAMKPAISSPGNVRNR